MRLAKMTKTFELNHFALLC